MILFICSITFKFLSGNSLPISDVYELLSVCLFLFTAYPGLSVVHSTAKSKILVYDRARDVV